MVAEFSATPVYHSPTSLPYGRERRGSGRKSFASTPLPSSMNSPRTLCPRDGDAFSYNPQHLSRWYIDQDFWERLPGALKSSLARMQHSGAAVLTGFERLELHSGDVDLGLRISPPEDEMLVQLDDSIASLPRLPPMLRTDSSVSSSAVTMSPSESGSVSPSMSASQSMSPVSPICLTPTDAQFPTKGRDRERSFSTPLEPHNAYYATELSQLRTEAVPRLRHAARKIDTEFYEAKRAGNLSADDVTEFENWWVDTKGTISVLDNQCKRLSHANGITSSGMGWTAP